MIASQERRVLLPHVHLQVRAEIHVFPGHEWHQRADRTHRRCVHDALRTPRLQRRPSQRAHRLTHVKLHNLRDFVRRAVERSDRCHVLPRRIVLDLVADVLRQSSDEDVSELIGAGDGVVIQGLRRGDVPRLCRRRRCTCSRPRS